MNNYDDPTILDKVVCNERIDQEALQDVYNQCIQEHRLAQAHHLLNQLGERFPCDHAVQHLQIALSIQTNNYTVAMQQIEALVAGCCPDNGLIDAALAVRAKIRQAPVPLSQCDCATLSLCMVVKNELSGLGACLNGAKKLVDEMVVVDTGSVDRTKDVAQIYGARVYEFKWKNDFAAARNFSLEKATGDWVLILDADEIIASSDHHALRSMLPQKGQRDVAYTIDTRNYTNLTNTIGWHANDGSYKGYEAGSGWFPTRKVRLFTRKNAIRFRFPVHERVDPDIRSMGWPIMDCPIPVHHYGHLNEVKKQKKARFYFELGYAKLEQFGNDLEAIRELAVQAGQLSKCAEAVALWQKFIGIKPDYAEAHTNLSGIYWQMGQYDKALVSARTAVKIDPQAKEAHYNLAISLLFLGNATESIDRLKQLLVDHPDYLVARFMLATAFCFAGDLTQSAQALHACQSMMPKETLIAAVKNQIAQLGNDKKIHGYGKRLQQALALMQMDMPNNAKM